MSAEVPMPTSRFRYTEKYREWVVVCILILVALVTRGYGIWEWSLIGDEYFTVAFAEERSKSFINPAYYLLVLGSIELFGLTEWSARLPSVILGTLSVPLFYVLCRRVLDRQAAIIGAFVIIFSEWHLYHSQLSRFYSGVFLFGVVSYFTYLKALHKNSYVLLGVALLSNVVGVLFHVTSILVPASCAGYSLVILLSNWTSTSYSKRIARAHFFIVIAAALIALPFFLSIAQFWSLQKGTSDPLGVLLDLAESVNIVLAMGASFGLLVLWRKDAPRGVFFAVGIGIPVSMLVLASLILPSVRAKYVFYLLPLIIFLAAFLCAQVKSLLPQYRVAKYAVAGMLIAGLLPGFVSHYTGHQSLDVRDAIRVIEQGYSPGDQIVVFDPAIAFKLKDNGLDESTRVVASKSVWRRALVPLEDEDHRVWILVDTYRHGQLRNELESWLMEHASLVWRKSQRRFDYSTMGYEIWLINGP